MTPAIRQLRQYKVSFEPHFYTYEEKGGTTVSARELGVSEAQVVKTLVMEDEKRNPLVVLMTGNHEVSTKQLARVMQVKTVRPCDPATAQKHSGYQVGGTSPFGTRKPLPVYAERGIFNLDRIYINGGRRGFLVAIAPEDIRRILDPVTVEVAV